jgi:hypothetical protein
VHRHCSASDPLLWQEERARQVQLARHEYFIRLSNVTVYSVCGGERGSLATGRASAKNRLLPLRANGCYARNRGGGLYYTGRQAPTPDYRIFGLVEVENRLILLKKFQFKKANFCVIQFFYCTGFSTISSTILNQSLAVQISLTSQNPQT